MDDQRASKPLDPSPSTSTFNNQSQTPSTPLTYSEKLQNYNQSKNALVPQGEKMERDVYAQRY